MSISKIKLKRLSSVREKKTADVKGVTIDHFGDPADPELAQIQISTKRPVAETLTEVSVILLFLFEVSRFRFIKFVKLNEFIWKLQVLLLYDYA